MVPKEFSTGVLFATSNQGKLAEVSLYARALGLKMLDIRSVAQGRGEIPILVEVAESYQGNAESKARAFARWSEHPCLADDTGIEIQRLNGLPGRFTARWGVDRVRSELGPVTHCEASFECALSFADPSGRVVTTRASVSGELRYLSCGGVRSIEGLPFSDYFYPRGQSEPLSVLVQRGVLVSHRFLALQALLKALA